jgi:DNA mismatch repair ATPase MutS
MKRSRDGGDGSGGKLRDDVMPTIVVVVENRARETTLAVASTFHLLQIYSLVDGPSYCETTDLLTLLSPDEVLLHSSSCQGASRSLMCRKIEEWRGQQTEHRPDIVPVSRAYFDQDRGAEFLRRVSTSKIDSDLLATYTVLGAGFALLKYIEQRCGISYPRASVRLMFINHNAGDFLTIDRRTATSLEIVNNLRSGNQKDCLFGVINRTKVIFVL